MIEDFFLTQTNIDNNSFFETDFTKKISTDNITIDFIGQPFNYKLNHENEENSQTNTIIYDDNLSKSLNNPNKKSDKLFSIYIQQKRGRKTNDNLPKIHGKFDEDNIIRKIQVSYINFIIDFMNILLIIINRKDLHFIPLNYYYKRKVNKEHRTSLKNTTIEEVLKNKISSKYSTKNENVNKDICEKIKKENINIFVNILKLNIFFFFDKIYYKNRRKFNLKEFGFDDLDVQLPNKIELFEDLIAKNKNEIHFEKYKIKLNNCAKKFFLPSRKDIFKCNY